MTLQCAEQSSATGLPESNTNRTGKELFPATIRLVRRTHGFVTAIARAGGFRPSYVSDVLAGRRPPSARFLRALTEAAEADGWAVLRAAVEAEQARQRGTG